ncbi:unnamed protein product [Dicrocoelium dendriticum]|nr:unnamed protein product [Dicrocoelium dendriticum]
MAPLTAAEVSSLLAELGPHAETQEKKEALGVSAYRALFGAKPEYINLFSKLQGLTIDNVFDSSGIKYYGATLVDEFVKIVQAAADDAALSKVLEDNGKAHTTRNVNKEQFLSGEPVFVDFFKKTLSNAQNVESMEKLLHHIFPIIAGHL